MRSWWLRVGKHPNCGKRVLESSRLKDTITIVDCEDYSKDGEPKDSVKQNTMPKRLGYPLRLKSTAVFELPFSPSWHAFEEGRAKLTQ